MLKLKLQHLATSCEELTHWKRHWCWEGLGAGGEGDYRGWDGWMASLTRWTWVWVNSRSWWWTGRPGMLRFMGSQRVGHDWVTELDYSYMSTLMSERHLKLTMYKSKLLICYKSLSLLSGNLFPSVAQVKNLGVILDSFFFFSTAHLIL